MSDDITPALSDEEWRAIGSDEIEPLADRLRDAAAEATLPFHDITRHAVAALALHGQPFGFTTDDLIGLCALSQKFDQETQVFLGYRNVDRAEFLRSLADRIAALLPP